ncbi:allophanate hydrolase [Aurantivibrio plasticivorans]
MQWQLLNITLDGLRAHYDRGDFTPRELIEFLCDTMNSEVDNPVWITQLDAAQLEPYLVALEAMDKAQRNALPLWGVPFAIKDNIDLAGVPTTAACADFTYTPKESAFVVDALIRAGAIPLGKTNMDQFATGLVGVRSPEPWGPCKNALNNTVISGGSSSGSAVAVAKGWVSFSLGTDTAGSGRVPAALNNIVGLKPSCGLLSNRGVVPACKSIDSVSIFALTASDANQVFDVASRFDETEPYARKNSYANGSRYFNANVPRLQIGVPQADQLEFFGNSEAETLFHKSCEALQALGHDMVAIDFSPFIQAAKLLYEGPWVTERYLALQPLIDESPDKLLPVIRQIVEPGGTRTATEAFSAQYQLETFARLAALELDKVDAVVTPTIGTHYSIADVLADPIQLNSNLGYYTNFMNLLDYAAVAVPTGQYENNVGFGITFFHQAMSDKRLLSLAAQVQHQLALPLGATGLALSSNNNVGVPQDRVNVVVCGAHLSGLPLNWQLLERGGYLVEVTQSAEAYRLFALPGGPPFRPGMSRDDESGQTIEVEVWSLPLSAFGSFVSEIPAPLGIGKVQLVDGRWEPGFICEAYGLDGAEDITSLGGWRNYIASRG